MSLPTALLFLLTPQSTVDGLTPRATAQDAPPVAFQAWFDLDRDGRPDRVMPVRGAQEPEVWQPVLERNLGRAAPGEPLGFRSVGPLPLPADARFAGAAFADFDADGRADLYLVGLGDVPDRLLRGRDDGSFGDVTPEFGVASTPTGRARRATWGDFDADGRVDLLLARDGASDLLFLREPAATFARSDPGLAPPLSDARIWTGDVDGDGDLDLYYLLGDPRRANLLYLDRGDGRFVERSAARALDLAGGARDAASGDLDGDDRAELVLAHPTGDVVLARDARGVYRELNAERGLGAGEPGHEHVRLVDADLDGALDLLLAGGAAPTVVLRRNDGLGRFEAPRELAPFPPGSSLALADVDADGAPELSLVYPDGEPEHFELGPGSGSALRVVPGGLLGAGSGLDAEVRALLPDGRVLRRRVAGAKGDEPAAWFGLGDDWRALEIRVEWSDGLVARVQGVPAAPIVIVPRALGARLVGSHPATLLDGPEAFDLAAGLARVASGLGEKLPDPDPAAVARRSDELLAFALARDLAQAPGPGTLAQRLAAAGAGGGAGARAFLGGETYDVATLAAAARATGLESRPEVAAALARIAEEVRLDTSVRALSLRERVSPEEVAAHVAARADDWTRPGRVAGLRFGFATREEAERACARLLAGESVGSLVTALDLVGSDRQPGYARGLHVAPFECDATAWARVAPELEYRELVGLGRSEPSPVFDGPPGAWFVVVWRTLAPEPFTERDARRRAELELRRARTEARVDELLGFAAPR